MLYSEDFQKKLKKIKNPYGNGGASDMIVRLLESANFENIIKKSFYDIV